MSSFGDAWVRYSVGLALAIFSRKRRDRSSSFRRTCVVMRSIATALSDPGTIYKKDGKSRLMDTCGVRTMSAYRDVGLTKLS